MKDGHPAGLARCGAAPARLRRQCLKWGSACARAAIALAIGWSAPALAQDAGSADVPADTAAAAASAQTIAAPDNRHDDMRIVWSVENRFRTYLNSRALELHEQAYAALTPRELERPVLSTERRLAADHARGWSAQFVGDICGDDGSPLNSACDNVAALFAEPGMHWIRARLTTASGSAVPPGICTWYLRPGGESVAARVAVEACHRPIRVALPAPRGGMLSVRRAPAPDSAPPMARTYALVEDLFIVGIGDSFASGEGNPDVPVQFDDARVMDYGPMPDGPRLSGYPVRAGRWDEVGDPLFLANGARWLSAACRRSAYGHQFRTAMQLALEDPHRTVTFANLACAGAEIVKGLFRPHPANAVLPQWERTPQLSLAARAQCTGRPTRGRYVPVAFTLAGRLPELKDITLERCPRLLARQIDLLLVSIGGNDIGFSKLVAGAVVADGSTLKEVGNVLGSNQTTGQTRARIAKLVGAYKALNRALHNTLHIPWREADRILITAYPPMTLRANGRDTNGEVIRDVCASGVAGLDVFPAYRLNAEQALVAERDAARLNRVLAKAAQTHGWTFVGAHVPAFIDRGLCAGALAAHNGPNEDLRFPRLGDGRWLPFPPSAYRPYARRQRWFRTPNDAFMTDNKHASRSLLAEMLKLGHLAWVQVAIASSYSGAFHPTAEGHAAIADSVVREARGVLARYRPREPEADWARSLATWTPRPDATQAGGLSAPGNAVTPATRLEEGAQGPEPGGRPAYTRALEEAAPGDAVDGDGDGQVLTDAAGPSASDAGAAVVATDQARPNISAPPQRSNRAGDALARFIQRLEAGEAAFPAGSDQPAAPSPLSAPAGPRPQLPLEPVPPTDRN